MVGSDGADFITPVGKNGGSAGRGEYVDADDLDIGFGGTGGGKRIELGDTPPDSPRGGLDGSIYPLVGHGDPMEAPVQEQSLEDKESILEGMKDQLVVMIVDKIAPLRSDTGAFEKVFTELMLEQIRLLEYLLKFAYYGSDLGDIEEQIGMISGKKDKSSSVDSINKIIIALSFLLEYDKEYYEILKSEGINFKNSSSAKGKPPTFTTGGKSWADLTINELKTEMAKLEDSSNLDEKENKVSIFKKNFALKKVLSKFDNKTYSARVVTDDTPISVQIKIQIAQIFLYLLDLRDDFLLTNVISFFNKKFFTNVKGRAVDDIGLGGEANYLALFKTVLPDLHFKGGENEFVGDGSGKCWLNYSESDEVKSFDKVIHRSFVEILIMAFYFAYDSILQNSIVKLLERFCTQRNSLMMNINKTVLICTKESSIIYMKINEINQALQNYQTESQVWLLIINKRFYHREYDISLTGALKKLKSLHSYLSGEKERPMSLKIKQDMMRQIGCQDNIINF